MASTCLADSSFGPAVVGCRGDFDFTITFEETVLSMLPSACFIVWAALRLWVLSSRQNSEAKGHTRAAQWLKSALWVVIVALDLAILVLAARQPPIYAFHYKIIAAGALSSIMTLLLLLVSNIEHTRSRRPSVLICLYLALTILFNVARARTWWLAFGRRPSTIVFLVKIVFMCFIILLEANPHPPRLQGDETHTDISPEETSGIFSLAFFYWLNPLIYMGSRKILEPHDLYPLDERLSEGHPLNGFNNLHRRTLADDSSSLTRLFCLVQTVGLSLLKPVPARLLLIGFSFAQPFFIQRLTSFLEEDTPEAEGISAGLIGASILIYSGLALSTSMYWYCHYRVLTRLRATMSHTIFSKALHLPTVDDGILTLMSLDVSRVYGGLHNVHELWANSVEVALAAWLLARQIGAVFVAPIVVVVICVVLTAAVGNFAARYQGDWSKKTEERVKLTSSVIARIKELQLSGRSTQIATLMQRLREDELDAGARFRLLGAVSVCVAFAPMLLAPLITFSFTSIGREVNTSQVYVSLSYLTLLSTPLSQLFQTVPSMLASTVSFKRIHDFLCQESRVEYRSTLHSTGDLGSKEVVSLQNASFGWQEDKWSLSNLNVTFSESQLSIVTGPIASGKSTFCQGILGGVSFVQGSVSVRPACLGQVGFCGQSPYLTDNSIRSNIVGPDQRFDGPRYKSVLWATLLDVDLRQLPRNDDTRVGSNGMNLSGGQKQRVALARALYLDVDLYVLDDLLSGLDTQTADEIVWRLFGDEGVLRSKTVIWCTHSTKYLSLAQQVIVLSNDGRLQSCSAPGADTTGFVRRSMLEAESKDDLLSNSSSSGQRQPDESMTERDSKKHLLRSRHDGQVYARYAKALSPRVVLLVLISGILFSFAYNFGTVWVGFWVRNSFHRPADESQRFYLGLFGLFQGCGLVALAGFLSCTEMQMPRQTGSQLHASALKCLFSLPLSYFSSVNTGTTTNLFSQDMGMLDNQLVFSISNTLLSGFTAIGQLVVVAVATPFIAIGYPFIFGVLYLLQSFYLKTSRQLRLLHLEAKSPVYSKFQDVVKGLTTIQAFQWMNQYQSAFTVLLNQSLQPDYLLDLVQQWLTLSLNIIAGLIALAVTCFATKIVAVSDVGLVGASLVSLMTFSELACATVRSWVELETSLGAVKRLKDFDENPTQEADRHDDPPKDWPTLGQIEIAGVSAAYGSETSEEYLVLREIHLSIAGGGKVAIIGRTGSGKSSILLLLLQLLRATPDTADKITVDSLPLQHINRQALRQRIIAVPQEMIFLSDSESFRDLLDPDGNLSDEQCRAAIAEVGLNDILEDLGGLDSIVSSDKLSHGQKQLLSLAVAVARKLCKDQLDVPREDAKTEKQSSGGVLLLDEVTSNVDSEVEDKIHEVIFRVFSNYTVVNITHRLRCLHLFDAVYAMSDGKMDRVKDVNALHI